MQTLKRLAPHSVKALYHHLLARSGTLRYGHPSRHLLVIGVTGTTGKSTVVEMLNVIFQAAGEKVGIASTIRFQVGSHSWMNNAKMTMPGRWQLQRLLRSMVSAGCTVAIVETTSEGIAQSRHLGIEYDAAVLTNLTPEHIESHGSFEQYRAAKGKLFAQLMRTARKKGRQKVSVVNLDDASADFFLRFPADAHVGFTLGDGERKGCTVVRAHALNSGAVSSDFSVDDTHFTLQLPGRHNIANALAAIAVAQRYGVTLQQARDGLAQLAIVPGRFEVLATHTPYDVVVDYAHEPVGLETVYTVARERTKHRLIAVLGAAGGGRDKRKRPTLGRLAAQYADVAIVTNEDPYDEDPQSIIDQVAAGAREGGKEEGTTLFTILERRDAIAKALDLARPGDLVLITGKGSEQSMVVAGGRKVPWNDGKTVTELLSVEKPAEKQ